MSAHDKIDLPPPAGHYYEWDGAYGKRKFTSAPHNGRECNRAVAYYTEDQVRAAIQSDRKRRGEPVVLATYHAIVDEGEKHIMHDTRTNQLEIYDKREDAVKAAPDHLSVVPVYVTATEGPLFAAPQPTESLSSNPRPLSSKPNEPVAWYTEDHLADKSATTWDQSVATRWRAKGWPVYPLYAAPGHAGRRP